MGMLSATQGHTCLSQLARGALPLTASPCGQTGSRARNPRSPSPSPSPICRGSGMGVPSPICRGPGIIPDPHPRFAGDRGFIPIPIPDLPKSGIQLSTIEYCKGVDCSGSPQCLTLIVNCHQSSLLIFEGRQCPMTPLTTAAAATRVIRSPPGSQLERNRAFWRMISASVMQLS